MLDAFGGYTKGVSRIGCGLGMQEGLTQGAEGEKSARIRVRVPDLGGVKTPDGIERVEQILALSVGFHHEFMGIAQIQLPGNAVGQT